MPTISRTIKTSGSPNVQTGDPNLASDLNDDMNTVFSAVNGLENVNIVGSANIDPTKIGDASADATAYAINTDPDVGTLPTTLVAELQHLRGGLKEIKGTTQWYDAFTAVPTQIATAIAPQNTNIGNVNLIRDGGFEAQWNPTTLAYSLTHWVLVGGPTVTIIDRVASEGQGNGKKVRVVAAGGLTGISQTLSNLRAGATYALSVAAKCLTATDDITVNTTGAAVDASATWSGAIDGTGFVRKTSTFTVNAVPTAVVVRLLATGAADTVEFDNVSVMEVAQNAQRFLQPGRSIAYLQTSTVGTDFTSTGDIWTFGTTDFEIRVLVPGPGYYIRVRANLGYTASTGGNDLGIELQASVDGGAFSTVISQPTGIASGGEPYRVIIDYCDLSPTGREYAFKIAADTSGGTVTPQGAASGIANTTNASTFYAEVIPWGS